MEWSAGSGAATGNRIGGWGRGTWRGTRRKSAFARIKPEGGFCFVPAMALIASWWAYKRSIVKLADLRVWLAIFEVMARRCGDRPRRFPPGVEHELAELTGLSLEVIRSALRRLERAGLLQKRETAFVAALDLDRLTTELREDLDGALSRVANHRRKVPLPRRLLRFLCGTTRPVLWATIIGHLLRCMYYRDGQCAPDGRCKASWVADVFEVDVRNVKAARRELMELGLLVREPSDQCSMNRWGPWVRFSLDWRMPGHRVSPPPRRGVLGGRLPPPGKNRELASRMENQQRRRVSLVSRFGRTWHIEPDELRSPQRLHALFERSVRFRLCRSGEAARLAFFATAARALRVASSNPAGLFATLVRGGHWRYATLGDEDLARGWLRKLRVPEPLKPQNQTNGPGATTVRPMEQRIESVGAVLSRLLAIGPVSVSQPTTGTSRHAADTGAGPLSHNRDMGLRSFAEEAPSAPSCEQRDRD